MRLLLLVLAIITFFPGTTLAQFNAVDTSVQLELQPRYPQANSPITVSLNAYAIDTNGAAINWIVDGEAQSQVFNERSISLTTGSIGEATSITVQITLPDGQALQRTQTITPTQLDLVIEADTLVPAFYRGRPEPSGGSTVHVTALPNIGTNSDPTSFAYTWRINNQVLGGGAIKGGYTRTFIMPTQSDAILTVDVSNESGRVVTSKSIVLPTTEPEIVFYEDNPLRGISPIAIQNNHQLIGDEITLRAEPYFMDTDIFTKDVFTEWSIDGSTIENPNNDPQLITLTNGGGRGLFAVEWHIRNLAELLQGARESVRIRI